MLAALPILLEPAARWLATRLGLSSTGWLVFAWPIRGGGVAAQFAELAAVLLLMGATIRVFAHGRAPGRA
jgi:hypothetical protein